MYSKNLQVVQLKGWLSTVIDLWSIVFCGINQILLIDVHMDYMVKHPALNQLFWLHDPCLQVLTLHRNEMRLS